MYDHFLHCVITLVIEKNFSPICNDILQNESFSISWKTTYNSYYTMIAADMLL